MPASHLYASGWSVGKGMFWKVRPGPAGPFIMSHCHVWLLCLTIRLDVAVHLLSMGAQNVVITDSNINVANAGLKGICNLPKAQSSALDGSPQSALQWISSLIENYAMVFDNADNLTPEELEQYFPPGLGGNILITSRNSGLKHLTLHESSLEVKEMEESDAISLLLNAAWLNESQEDLQAEASKILLIRLVLSLLLGHRHQKLSL
ncbi:uncharacterized protein LACBIDRAFT_328275 [Laccaria bicolor S238N-H82]|uniref:Predicted protein n=1 Tax=Laccaria bicolor (strain S238N-H82 / ATCC MYA-4686) TaxID=486041 RepID=B0DED7_LACBS|nr:uncharacterized protein LACBIDRAFT_328275 [Laccaria bicolor S238N-H82]EDR06913.1 predicted protein [Laccaria bicolor S238N-H82]|eukprot:XP_001882286.1 predicted protein [Laccaria bicolor S238N-H82]